MQNDKAVVAAYESAKEIKCLTNNVKKKRMMYCTHNCSMKSGNSEVLPLPV